MRYMFRFSDLVDEAPSDVLLEGTQLSEHHTSHTGIEIHIL